MAKDKREWWINERFGTVSTAEESIDNGYHTHVVDAEWKEQALALAEALWKIADPRKRDHREPDAYTELGCVMHIADTAVTKFEEWMKGRV